jgi:hypothetical protein
VVRLSDAVDVTSSVLAATPTAVRIAYNLAAAAIPKSTVTNAGDVIYATGSASVASLGIGTAGQVLTVNAGATAPEWATATGGGITASAFEAFSFGAAGVCATGMRFNIYATESYPGTGTIYHTRLIPHKNFIVSNISFTSGSTITTTTTLARFGIYTRSGTTFTLVARTASDTTIFGSINTKYTRALNTTGGYPSTYTMTAGAEYFVSFIVVAGSVGGILTLGPRLATSANVATGPQQYSQTIQTDLAASSTGSLSTTAGGIYAEVS